MVKMRILDGVLVRGRAVAPGDVIDATPGDAADLIACGRAELLDPRDRGLLHAAHREEVMRGVRESARAAREAGWPADASPWRRVG